MFDNIKFPLLIVSSPRTGSTILGDYLSQLYPKMKFFSEPNLLISEYNKFLEYSENSKDFILKIHAKHIDNYNLNFNDFYIMRIRRRDIISQIASYYVAHMRDKYFGYNPDDIEYKNYKNSEVNYDVNILNFMIDYTFEFNEYLDNIDKSISIDKDFWYEDLDLDLNKTIYDDYRVFKTPYPKNYDFIKTIISEKLENKKKYMKIMYGNQIDL